MKPEPPIGSAIPKASAAPASGAIRSQPSSTRPRRPASLDDRRGREARDHAGEDPVADLLRDDPRGRPVADHALLRLRDPEGDEEERHADPVVETAFDVQSLPDPRRELRERDDRLAERGVGGGEDHREDERLRPRERPENGNGDDESEYERQRETDPEQARRHRDLVAERAKVDPGRVREEDERERRLGEELDGLTRSRTGRRARARRRRGAARRP